MDCTIRDARLDDLDAINEIYNESVLNSTATYDETPVSRAARLEWWHEHGPAYPVLVAERDGQVLGWASLSRHKERCAYRFTVESSVYLRPDARGQRLGTRLMTALLERVPSLGYHSVIAGVSADQEVSLRLHRGLGFVQVAHFREVGFKFGRWLDVIYLQRMFPPAHAPTVDAPRGSAD